MEVVAVILIIPDEIEDTTAQLATVPVAVFEFIVVSTIAVVMAYPVFMLLRMTPPSIALLLDHVLAAPVDLLIVIVLGPASV